MPAESGSRRSPEPRDRRPGPSGAGSKHGYARAAGRATRTFLDGSRREASARDRRSRGSRQATGPAAAPGTPAGNSTIAAPADSPAPTALRVARWWWLAVTVLFTVLAAVFAVAGVSWQPGVDGPAPGAPGLDGLPADPLEGRPGQYVLAVACGAVAVASAIGTVQLLRRRRGAVSLLTGVAVIVGVPLLVRGAALLLVLAILLLVGAALLWLPPVRRQLR